MDEFDGTAYRLTVITPDCARGLAAGLDLEREMIHLLQEIRAHIDSKGLARPFWIVVSNGRHKILTISKPQNALWCDRTHCSNNGALLSHRHLAMPIEEIFFDLGPGGRLL